MGDNRTTVVQGQRILIAEDEAIIAMLLENVIERLGGEVIGTARTCAEVLAALETAQMDAIILDVHLKGGTSETVVIAAQKRAVPVLVCTGSDALSLPSAFLNLPILKKPWHSEDVDAALNQLFSAPA